MRQGVFEPRKLPLGVTRKASLRLMFVFQLLPEENRTDEYKPPTKCKAPRDLHPSRYLSTPRNVQNNGRSHVPPLPRNRVHQLRRSILLVRLRPRLHEPPSTNRIPQIGRPEEGLYKRLGTHAEP